MKALSLWQPWASWIAEGHQTIETRTWRTHYRGPLLICAAARTDRLLLTLPGPFNRHLVEPRRAYPTRCAVALARLTDVRPMVEADQAAACCALFPGAWAWVLQDVRRIEPFPVMGRQGLFEVDAVVTSEAFL